METVLNSTMTQTTGLQAYIADDLFARAEQEAKDKIAYYEKLNNM